MRVAPGSMAIPSAPPVTSSRTTRIIPGLRGAGRGLLPDRVAHGHRARAAHRHRTHAFSFAWKGPFILPLSPPVGREYRCPMTYSLPTGGGEGGQRRYPVAMVYRDRRCAGQRGRCSSAAPASARRRSCAWAPTRSCARTSTCRCTSGSMMGSMRPRRSCVEPTRAGPLACNLLYGQCCSPGSMKARPRDGPAGRAEDASLPAPLPPLRRACGSSPL